VLRPLMLAAAVLGGVPDIPSPPTPAPADQRAPQPASDAGEGGPYEPVEPAMVTVEAEPVAAPRPFSIAPDPVLERLYAPRERAPLNRVTIPF